ncbi:sensor histidine kinase [Rhizobium alvei]|uniref:C4-dicarboxylate transport sensor protein n=1 Tax=Rhizobium alvei TaxID=1132659 RepID=A0ABT8YNY1_9HYPH|nr:ATP-binding protein [Rhizobium alvei]MDO6965431.1 ATP-binding protein [Rhizobium alvei]
MNQVDDFAPTQTQSRTLRLWLMALSLVLAALVGTIGWHYGRSLALADLVEQARSDAELKIALMQAALERPRAVPLILSLDKEVADALSSRSGVQIDRLNRKLEGLVSDSQASVIYVIGPDGRAIASSNWREPTSFIGNNYSFRAYFSDAMRDGRAEEFALGSVSKRPGLYLSRRVDGTRGPLGIVVVKSEFDGIEARWQATGRATFISDQRGIILISSLAAMRFNTLVPLPAAERTALRNSMQFGQADLHYLPLPVDEAIGSDLSLTRAALPGLNHKDTYLHLTLAVPSTPWSLHYLLATDAEMASRARQTMFLALAGFIPVLAGSAILIRRRQMSQERLTTAARIQAELERRVRERTEDLTQARDALEAEIAGHKSTEHKLKGVQQDLVAANRLAILGQVSAGVAHEINQPLATIRAYADNGAIFLTRRKNEAATENFAAIARLTERIADITDGLRNFARKGHGRVGPTRLTEVLEGAALLLRTRFSGRMEALQIERTDPDLMVLGEGIRLEQIFINLFQNALEALAERPEGRVRVETVTIGEMVCIRVADNGPGLSEEVQAQLFSPFNTSKERGLGLGLVISQEIAKEFGGRIEVASSTDGATFDVYLRKA